jgi:predicted dehydrogenase
MVMADQPDPAAPIRVGIVGASPTRGWALSAHLPALAGLPGFTVTAVSTTRQETADETAARFAVPHAFHDAARLAASDDVDLVVVSVKVPYHSELTAIALDAGKDVYTEWPLGASTAQAQELTTAAAARGVRHVIGLQGRKGPIVNYVRHLVASGYVGRVLSVSMSVVSAGRGGTTVAPDRIWASDRDNGATLLTVSAGHSLDTLRYALGEITDLSARVVTLDPRATVIGTSETITVTSPDNVLVQGRLASGAVLSAQFLSAPGGSGSSWTIYGEDGVLEIAGSGLPHYADAGLTLRGAQGTGALEPLTVPASYDPVPAAVPDGPARNVAGVYLALADAIATGTPADPGFTTALSLHRLLDAIQASSDRGALVTVSA